MNKFALWVGKRDRVSFPVPIGIRNKKRSLGFFDNRKVFSESKHPEHLLA